MSDRTYIVGLSHEEIRDTRQALVLWAQTYRDLAEHGKFTPETKAILNREADGAMDVANRLSSIITQRANVDQQARIKRADAITLTYGVEAFVEAHAAQMRAEAFLVAAE